MWPVPQPDLDARTVYTTCISKARPAKVKHRLQELEEEVVAASDKYERQPPTRPCTASGLGVQRYSGTAVQRLTLSPKADLQRRAPRTARSAPRSVGVLLVGCVPRPAVQHPPSYRRK